MPQAIIDNVDKIDNKFEKEKNLGKKLEILRWLTTKQPAKNV